MDACCNYYCLYRGYRHFKECGILKSIVQKEDDRCFICGRQFGLAEHHALHGVANRKLADKYHLVVKLCERCHYVLHNQDKELDRYVERAAQQAFEEKYSHDEFMRIFKKNYL